MIRFRRSGYACEGALPRQKYTLLIRGVPSRALTRLPVARRWRSRGGLPPQWSPRGGDARRPGRFAEVIQDLPHGARLVDEGDNPHPKGARQQHGPQIAGCRSGDVAPPAPRWGVRRRRHRNVPWRQGGDAGEFLREHFVTNCKERFPGSADYEPARYWQHCDLAHRRRNTIVLSWPCVQAKTAERIMFVHSTETYTMNIRKPLVAALWVASCGVASIPISSNAATVYFNTAPPPARVEVIPAPRAGYLWVPGFWDARGHRHAWSAGRWERERHGYRFVEPRWEQRDNRWALERGRWARGDRDGDGVPNRFDRAPNNPRRH